jgi:hypothetical protein
VPTPTIVRRRAPGHKRQSPEGARSLAWPAMTTTSDAGPGSETRRLVRRSILMFIGMAGVSGALTVLWFSMRAVMEIGGSCASGNVPYAISRPCPSGVPGLMVGSIFLGLAFLGLYAVTAVGPNLTLFAWPALFLSLGWNFMDFGISPPDGNSGPVWGWIICGVIFLLMGGIPLVLGIAALMKGRALGMTGHPRRLVNRYGSSGATSFDSRGEWRFGLALQLVAMAVGIWLGIQIYEWGSGTTVSIHFG